jgi:hypothetical protein
MHHIGNVPVGNDPVEGLGLAKHPIHACHIGDIPRGQILVEKNGLVKHLVHIFSIRHIPRQNVLIKGIYKFEDTPKCFSPPIHPTGSWDIHMFVQTLQRLEENTVLAVILLAVILLVRNVSTILLDRFTKFLSGQKCLACS